MAFKRRTKRGGGGNRTTTTYNTRTGTTHSSSYSSTGSQKTKSGGVRYTNRRNSDGSTTKVETRHLANGYVERKQRTIGKFKMPKAPKVSKPRRSSSRSSVRMSKAFSKNDSAGLFLLAMIFGGAWVLITYWQYILVFLVAAGLVYALIKLNK